MAVNLETFFWTDREQHVSAHALTLRRYLEAAMQTDLSIQPQSASILTAKLRHAANKS